MFLSAIPMAVRHFTVLSFLFLWGCSPGPDGDKGQGHPQGDQGLVQAEDRDRIMTCMASQEASWNSGDLEGFMEPYWRSDSLLFVGSRGATRGWDATLENYRKGYPDRTAMGRLTFGVESLDFPGTDIALMVGSWRLDDRGDLEPLSGWFSLVWRRIDGQWRIIRDHSS